MALTIGIGLLQAAPEFLGGEHVASIGLSFLLWVLEMPLQVLALSVVFVYGVKQQFGTTSVLFACLFVAVAIGVLFGLAFVILFERLLGVALDEKGPLELPLVAGFGAFTGIIFAAIWGLAFVSPYLTEQAQLRRLETERLRLEAEQLRTASELARLRSQLEPHFLLNPARARDGVQRARDRSV